ncbi:MAG: MFS transporter, partial [Proteobacteria bacterium]|nr:MFS transporter [Pseudomonadota bacterium]
QMIGWGTSFSALPIFGTPISNDLALAREWVFGGITLMLFVSAVLAPRVGRLIDRMGARPIMVVGSLLGALSMLLQSRATGLPSYMLGWFVQGVATTMMLGNAAMPGLVQVVGPNARSAITSLMLISGITSTVFLPFNAWLLGTIGWRNAYLAFAVLHLCVCAPLHWVVLKPRARKDVEPGTAKKAVSQFPEEGVLRPDERRRGFLLLATWVCAEGLITWGLYLQVIDLFVASGLTMSQAIGVWTLVGPTQSLARLGELLSGGRHSILATTLGASLGVSLAFVLILPFGVSVTTCVIFCVSIGIGHGLFAVARNTLPLALFGVKEFGAYMGLLSLPQNIINAIAPIVFAAIISRGTPIGVLWIAAISAWIGLVAVWLLIAHCRQSIAERGIKL